MEEEVIHVRDVRFDSTATAVEVNYLPQLNSVGGRRNSKDSINDDEKDLDSPIKSTFSNDGDDQKNTIIILPELLNSTSNTSKNNNNKKDNKSSWLTQGQKELSAVFAMIMLVGLNDAAIGANLNSIQTYYVKTDNEIDAVFFFNVAGYLSACLGSSFITAKIGLRYSLLMGGILLCSGCLLISFAPPYPAFVIGLSLLGGGSGTFDSNLTTIVSHYENAVIMSIYFGMYGVGALLSPILAGTLLDAGIKWNLYYYIPLAFEIFLSAAVFPIFGNYILPQDEPDLSLPMDSITLEAETKEAFATSLNQETAKEKLKRALKRKSVWVGFLLIFIAFGQGDMVTGWITTYLIDQRGVSAAISRYELSGYWAGIALGRIALGFVGQSLGEKTFSILALGCAAISACILWLVKNQIVDAVALAFIGLFLGPVMPKVFSMVGARTPASLKGLVMSLLLSVGLMGSCLLPICFGLAADKGALGSLPAVLMVTCLIAGSAWTLVPRMQVAE